MTSCSDLRMPYILPVVESPLKRTGNTWTYTALFASTADDTVADTNVKTAFAPTGVGSATILANTLVVGQTYKITVRGVLSTA